MSNSITLRTQPTITQMLSAAVGELRTMLTQRKRPAAASADNVWQLYRMSAGTDSVRPAVLASLEANARRN